MAVPILRGQPSSVPRRPPHQHLGPLFHRRIEQCLQRRRRSILGRQRVEAASKPQRRLSGQQLHRRLLLHRLQRFGVGYGDGVEVATARTAPQKELANGRHERLNTAAMCRM